MSTVRNKSRYDKEMSAVTYNLKEQRVLEKSMQTLNLEQTYAIKLLELDNRIIKVHYKKLKERVSKIKSHLPIEDINKFRDLDLRGKLKPTRSGLSVSSAVKIAAAARRLNLNDGRNNHQRSIRSRGGARSALPRISVAPEGEDEPNTARKSQVSFSMLEPTPKLKRSNSVTGVFIDAPVPNPIKRPGSAFVSPHITTSDYSISPVPMNGELDDSDINNNFSNGILLNGRHNQNGLPNGTHKAWENNNTNNNGRVEYLTKLGHRPTSSVNFKIEKSSEMENGSSIAPAEVSDVTKRASTAPHPSHSHSRFSSHSAMEKEGKTSNGLAIPTPREDSSIRRASHISRDSIDSNLGENLFEERRQEMLEEESVRAATLDKRTKMFLKGVEEYLKLNPPLQPSHVAFEHPLPAPPRRDSFEPVLVSKDPFGDQTPHGIRMNRRRNERPVDDDGGAPTSLPEDKYRQRLMGLWKDMNKCRYLRVSDDKIDLSGVNTLVKDQLKLFQVLKNPDGT